MTLRARFPNPQGVLLPGMFVQALFDQAVEPQRLPRAASRRSSATSAARRSSSSSGRATRPSGARSSPTRTLGADWVVTAGLNAGDKVITQGLGQPEAGRADQAGAGQRAAADRARPSRRRTRRRRARRARRLGHVAHLHRPADLRLGAGDHRHAGRHRRDHDRCRSSNIPTSRRPKVNIRASYPGASAETVENSVTQILEQQLTGLDGLLYFSSHVELARVGQHLRHLRQGHRSRHRPGAGPEQGPAGDLAAAAAGAAAGRAGDQVEPGLPAASSRSMTRPTPRTNQDVSDYLASNIQDPLSRVPGVGDVNVFGAPHAMRIWLNPQRLAAFALMPSDVITAIQNQNTEVAAGEVGGLPQRPRADAQRHRHRPVAAADRRSSSSTSSSRPSRRRRRVRLGDVARVEIGAENYSAIIRVNGHPGAGIAISLAPGADALEDRRTGQGRGRRTRARLPRRPRHTPTPTTPPTSSSCRSTRSSRRCSRRSCWSSS